MDKAEIKKIVLDLGGKEVNLSLDQAKKVSEILGEMFGKKEIATYPIYVEKYKPYWTYPSYNWCDNNVQCSYTTTDASMKISC